MPTSSSLSMPYWCVGYQGFDPFGPGVLDSITSLEISHLLGQARKEGLIEMTSAHDDDLVRWNPYALEDDQDTQSDTFQTLAKIKKILASAGLKFAMVTCNLHGNPVFRNGGLTNPDPEIRLLAARKVMRTIRIGNFLGAECITYWVARDGFESQFAVPWNNAYSYLRQGLDLAQWYASTMCGSVRYGTIEPKPNEPRGEMFLPTTGHALGLIAQLADPAFWGVNPEILQHEGMINLSAVLAVIIAAQAGKLPFIHIGCQRPGQFDNDNPVLTGSDGLKETVAALWALKLIGWEGHVEFDNHMLRSDTVPGAATRERMAFIRLNVENFRMAETKAEQLFQNAELRVLQEILWGRNPELAKLLEKVDPASIFNATVDYDEVNKRSLKIARLDQVVNRILMGL